MSLHTDNKAVTVLVQKQHQILLWNIQVQLTLQLIRGMFPSFVTKMDEVFRMQMYLHTDNKAVTALVPKQTTKLICETFRDNWLCSWLEGCFPASWTKWTNFSPTICTPCVKVQQRAQGHNRQTIVAKVPFSRALKLQALVYNILPPTIAVINYIVVSKNCWQMAVFHW